MAHSGEAECGTRARKGGGGKRPHKHSRHMEGGEAENNLTRSEDECQEPSVLVLAAGCYS